MRFLGELAQARNDGIDIERASTVNPRHAYVRREAV